MAGLNRKGRASGDVRSVISNLLLAMFTVMDLPLIFISSKEEHPGD